MVRMLLDAGADVYALSYSGKSVRHSATKSGSVQFLQLIAKAEAKGSPPKPRNEPADLSTNHQEILVHNLPQYTVRDV
jgi:hypothetical protein